MSFYIFFNFCGTYREILKYNLYKGSTENQYFLNCQQLCSGRGRSLVILSKCGTETLIVCTIATKLVTSSNRGRQARALPVTEGWLTFLSNRINGMSLQGANLVQEINLLFTFGRTTKIHISCFFTLRENTMSYGKEVSYLVKS